MRGAKIKEGERSEKVGKPSPIRTLCNVRLAALFHEERAPTEADAACQDIAAPALMLAWPPVSNASKSLLRSTIEASD